MMKSDAISKKIDGKGLPSSYGSSDIAGMLLRLTVPSREIKEML